MRKFDINTLDQKLEKIVSKTVKYYYSDWKNYDRPKYMTLKGDPEVKSILLIARSCGTYLFSDKELEKESCKSIIDYFKTQESADFYNIDMINGTIKKVMA